MSDLESFRAEARTWLEENCHPKCVPRLRGMKMSAGVVAISSFRAKPRKSGWSVCAAKGYTVPDWPKAYGGAGLSPQESKVLRQEMAKLGCRSPLNSFGIWMLGPALLKFGTEEQKVYYLNQIARGEIRWCQGYSEPGSGSDLCRCKPMARTRATIGS